MSPEAKEQRKIRIGYNWVKDKDGNYLSPDIQLYVDQMKIDRIGGGNPAAIPIVYKGIFYGCKQDVIKILPSNEKKKVDNLLLDISVLDCYYVNERIERIYEIGTCEHCNKTANMTSAFKRWHFDNCKMKGIL